MSSLEMVTWRDGLGPAVAPLATLFAAGVVVRRWAYDQGILRAWTPPVPTVSVGGLEVGGSGKTQVAQLLLRAFCAGGRRPGLLTRGFRRQSRGLVTRRSGEPVSWAQIGDEAAMIIQSGIDVPVAACANRRQGARALCENMACDTLVLDDAFSHRALGRHIEIVVLRGENPLGNGHLVPWGTLREPPSSLARADVVWLHYRLPGQTLNPRWPRFGTPQTVRVVSRSFPAGAQNPESGPIDIRGARVLAAAGIARPEELRNSLAYLGAEVVELVPFADHHRYTRDHLEWLWCRARELAVDGVVVTPKDLVKLGEYASGAGLWVVGTRLVIEAGGDALAARLGIDGSALGQDVLKSNIAPREAIINVEHRLGNKKMVARGIWRSSIR